MTFPVTTIAILALALNAEGDPTRPHGLVWQLPNALASLAPLAQEDPPPPPPVEEPKADPLATLEPFIGNWEGTLSPVPGSNQATSGQLSLALSPFFDRKFAEIQITLTLGEQGYRAKVVLASDPAGNLRAWSFSDASSEYPAPVSREARLDTSGFTLTLGPTDQPWILTLAPGEATEEATATISATGPEGPKPVVTGPLSRR